MIRKKFNLAALHYWDYEGRNKLSYVYQNELIRQFRELKRLFQKNKCFYCQREMVDASAKGRCRCTAEHLVPVSHGGKNEVDNIVAACWGCNSTRATGDWLEFLKTRHPLYR